MEFKELKGKLQDNFKEMSKNAIKMFEVDVDKDEMWGLYLSSFPAGTNNIFRERTDHDCSCCRHFIKNIGNVVFIIDNKINTIWDFNINSTTYQPVIDALSAYVKSKVVSDIYVTKLNKIGTDSNFEEVVGGEVIKWEHFYLELPSKFVTSSIRTEGDIKGEARSLKDVFKRSLDEITEDSILTVLELISQNSLYKGEEWKGVLESFLTYKREYDVVPNEDKDNYVWVKSSTAGGAVGKIKNHSIGTLLMNISENMDLDIAVKKYESIVAPSNYKRPNAIFTQRMLDDAKKTIEDLGYMDSLDRRFATLDDITVNNIIFSNRDSAGRMLGMDVFSDMSKDLGVNVKNFAKVEEITIDDFIKNVIPRTKEIEVLLENKHSQNLVSLIAPENKDSNNMFKWGNKFSWAYTGNITDSSMKENVKSAGGNVNGVLRFSIQWNDNEPNSNDLDAHCKEPSGNEIYYGNDENRITSGVLDVDIINPITGRPAVENITWLDRSKMEEGVYKFFVHNYTQRNGRDGFRAEIEFDGQIYSFDYGQTIRQGGIVQVAEVTFSRNTGFTIVEKLPSNISNRTLWNLQTNQFVPVSVLMFSPNYWDEQMGIGNKHYFFMMKDCINEEMPNAFYNEFIKEELMKYKKVFEALGGKKKVANTNDQLSGLGFSSTKRNELIVKVKGNIDRMLKIKF